MQHLGDERISALVSLLEDDKLADLRQMHSQLNDKEGGLELLRKTMGKHLRDTGKGLVMDQERCKDPVEFVQSLLELWSKYDMWVTTSSCLQAKHVPFATPPPPSLFSKPSTHSWMPSAVSASLHIRTLICKKLVDSDWLPALTY